MQTNRTSKCLQCIAYECSMSCSAAKRELNEPHHTLLLFCPSFAFTFSPKICAFQSERYVFFKLTKPIIDNEPVNNASNSIIFNLIHFAYEFSHHAGYSFSFSLLISDIVSWWSAYTIIMCACVCFDWRTSVRNSTYTIYLVFIWHIQMINDIRIFIVANKKRAYTIVWLAKPLRIDLFLVLKQKQQLQILTTV